MNSEGAFVRRLISISAMVVALAVVAPLFPALLVLALVVDLLRLARTLSTTRLMGFLLAFLAVENLGLLLLFFTFLTTRAGTRARTARTFAIQRLYTAAHLTCVRALFSLRFVVENAELARTGPFVAFVRHASLVDVLVPGAFIANVHRVELRYVLKKELLAEPCLDLAGHWIPNHFVSRSGEDTQRELAAISALKRGIGEREGRRAGQTARVGQGDELGEHVRMHHLGSGRVEQVSGLAMTGLTGVVDPQQSGGVEQDHRSGPGRPRSS